MFSCHSLSQADKCPLSSGVIRQMLEQVVGQAAAPIVAVHAEQAVVSATPQGVAQAAVPVEEPAAMQVAATDQAWGQA